MGLTHIRLPKNFNLDERLERYADAIETNAPALVGRWAEACWPLDPQRKDARAAYAEVHLDLGCGKGSFIAQCARQKPEALYLGMDVEPICIAYAAQRACEEGLCNMVLIPRGADALPQLFAAGELSAITLNFPTPYPKRHHARRRLVNVDHLLGFRQLLAPGGTVTLRVAREAPRAHESTAALPADMALFERLKELRLKFAKRAGVPAFVIFTDATLRAMSAQKPRTMAEFLKVPGVGGKKADAYGKAFLERIGEES